MSRSYFTTADGCKLAYEMQGSGKPVLWQHGLGAPFAQPAQVFPDDPGLLRITLACRGHESSDLGDREKLSITTFADDCLALLDHLGIAQAAVGGISLGAGIAMRLAAIHPKRVTQLIVARPAWIDRPSLDTQAIYLAVAEAIRTRGLDEGLKHLKQLSTFTSLEAISPDNAKSALSYFTRPRPETTVALLSTISASHPGLTQEQISSIRAPALVIANREDVVHPLSYAEVLASLLPNSKIKIITSKTVNPSDYEVEFKAALSHFLSGERA